MASPPFNPNEALPSDTGIVSQFPGQERTFREIIESWLLWEHGRSGHHAFLRQSTSSRDADSTWEAGSIVFNTTLNALQFCTSIGPIVWKTLTFDSGTRMFFNQTAAPTGWTKITDAAYENAGIKLTTGTVDAPTGDVNWTDIFKAVYNIAGSTAGHALTIAQMPPHTHGYVRNASTVGRSGTDSQALANTTTAQSDPAGSGEQHSHSVSLNIDIALKTVEAIVASKDA